MGGEGGADVAGAESGFVRWRQGRGGLGLWVVGDVWMGDGRATGMVDEGFGGFEGLYRLHYGQDDHVGCGAFCLG